MQKRKVMRRFCIAIADYDFDSDIVSFTRTWRFSSGWREFFCITFSVLVVWDFTFLWCMIFQIHSGRTFCVHLERWSLFIRCFYFLTSFLWIVIVKAHDAELSVFVLSSEWRVCVCMFCLSVCLSACENVVWLQKFVYVCL